MRNPLISLGRNPKESVGPACARAPTPAQRVLRNRAYEKGIGASVTALKFCTEIL